MPRILASIPGLARARACARANRVGDGGNGAASSRRPAGGAESDAGSALACDPWLQSGTPLAPTRATPSRNSHGARLAALMEQTPEHESEPAVRDTKLVQVSDLRLDAENPRLPLGFEIDSDDDSEIALFIE